MHHYLLILLSTVLVNNFVLTRFLGLCPFMGVSRQLESAVGMGLATTFVMTLASIASYLTDTYLLAPWGLGYLRIISFIVIIAACVQFTELYLRHSAPLLQQLLGIYLPLITTNCAVLGVALLNVQHSHSLLESAVYGAGAALGFSLVLVLFAGLRQRLDAADVPQAFRGSAIALITAGIMSLAFMGFGGMVTG